MSTLRPAKQVRIGMLGRVTRYPPRGRSTRVRTLPQSPRRGLSSATSMPNATGAMLATNVRAMWLMLQQTNPTIRRDHGTANSVRQRLRPPSPLRASIDDQLVTEPTLLRPAEVEHRSETQVKPGGCSTVSQGKLRGVDRDDGRCRSRGAQPPPRRSAGLRLLKPPVGLRPIPTSAILRLVFANILRAR